jgi:hypothetical protein
VNDRAAFTSTMAALSTALPTAGRPITEATFEVYWRALAPLSDAEFQRGAEVCLRRCRFFPVPSELLDAGRPVTDSAADAFRVMNRALLLTDYDPEGGTTWRIQRLREELGEATAQAFLACGGAPAFRQYDSPFHGAAIRKAFMESYQRSVLLEPQLALPAGPDRTPNRLRELVAETSAGLGRLPLGGHDGR